MLLAAVQVLTLGLGDSGGAAAGSGPGVERDVPSVDFGKKAAQQTARARRKSSTAGVCGLGMGGQVCG